MYYEYILFITSFEKTLFHQNFRGFFLVTDTQTAPTLLKKNRFHFLVENDTQWKINFSFFLFFET